MRVQALFEIAEDRLPVFWRQYESNQRDQQS
jgi:hypothetical protein